ncbi:MAG: hypothetical protein JSS34_00975 [Proteobacteria bacterium]|nr:hypothetical protein [Pseudomonadota bacterium]
MRFKTLTMTTLSIFLLGLNFSFASDQDSLNEEKKDKKGLEMFLNDSRVYREETTFGGLPFSIETGGFARQADGSAVVRLGGTTVLATVDIGKPQIAAPDFDPLMVSYRTPGFEAFQKQEEIPGKPQVFEEVEENVADQLKRTISLLLSEGWARPMTVTCDVLEGHENRDVAAFLAASAALKLSGVPIREPFGAARVALVDGNYVINPKIEERKKAYLDMLLTGTVRDLVTIEGRANELPETSVLEALAQGQKEFKNLIAAMDRLANKAGMNPATKKYGTEVQAFEDIKKKVSSQVLEELKAVPQEQDWRNRKVLLEGAFENLEQDPAFKGVPEFWLNKAFFAVYAAIVREEISHGKRQDKRKLKESRELRGEAGLFSGDADGSAFVSSGENQALAKVKFEKREAGKPIVDERWLVKIPFDSLTNIEQRRRPGLYTIDGISNLFMEKAFRPVLPLKEEFLYQVQVDSEIMGIDGAADSVALTGISVALRDAGVPLKNLVTGTTVGVLKKGEKFVVLSDMAEDEKRACDMNFTIAGTQNGITALKADIKIPKVRAEIFKKAIEQAREDRRHKLEEMAEIKILEHPKPERHVSFKSEGDRPVPKSSFDKEKVEKHSESKV